MYFCSSVPELMSPAGLQQIFFYGSSACIILSCLMRNMLEIFIYNCELTVSDFSLYILVSNAVLGPGKLQI